MADPKEGSESAASAETPNAPSPTPDAQLPTDSKLEIARRFLLADEVKNSPRESKIEFLKSKGLEDDEIEALLQEQSLQSASAAEDTPDDATDSSALPSSSASEDSLPSDQPPVITYPEFLTKPSRPAPLVTPSGILSSLYALAGFTSLLYGGSKYLVAPMVENLTDARHSLHERTIAHLATLVDKLEHSVSSLPDSSSPLHPQRSEEDNESDIEDPTEMFHRDVGTQTSEPSSPLPSPWTASERETTEPASTRQFNQVALLVKSLEHLSRDSVSQSEELVDVKTLLDVLKDEVDNLASSAAGAAAAAGASEWASSWSMPRKEPDDEIKRAKENIRRVKGVLLSTKNFPASAR